MTVGQLRLALADSRLTDDSEVKIEAREGPTHDCDCACCCNEMEIGVLYAGVMECGKRTLVLIPEETLRPDVPLGIEEGEG